MSQYVESQGPNACISGGRGYFYHESKSMNSSCMTNCFDYVSICCRVCIWGGREYFLTQDEIIAQLLRYSACITVANLQDW